MFADDFIGLITKLNAEDLQKLINVKKIKRVLLLRRLLEIHIHGSGEIK